MTNTYPQTSINKAINRQLKANFLQASLVQSKERATIRR